MQIHALLFENVPQHLGELGLLIWHYTWGTTKHRDRRAVAIVHLGEFHPFVARSNDDHRGRQFLQI